MPTYATVFGPVPFRTADATRVGLTREALRTLVAREQVRRLVRGVFVDRAVGDSIDVRARAISLASPSGSVICGRTAAWLWGVDALAMGAHRVLPKIDVMGAAGRSAARREGVLGSTGPLPDSDVVALLGALVTTPARTAADLARQLRRPDALAALDAMLSLPGLTHLDIETVLTRFAKHRGVVQARELLAMADPRSESPQESRARLRCVDSGFPAPEPQIEVYDGAGGFVARLDLGWRWLMRAFEFDGDEAHSTPAQQRHDRERRARVERFGWGLAVVTSEQVLSRGLAFERGIAELTGLEPRLTKHHPRYGGWDGRGWGA